MTSTPVILDVDTGVDDAMALAYAVASPSLDVVAVTTLSGNVSVDNATANTLTILDFLDAADVPVHRGASRPLVGANRGAMHVHGEDGLGGASFPRSQREVGPDRGPAAMIRLAKARPGELTLVCLGPLTNLAIALNVEPELGEWLRRVVIMGGAFRSPGNVTPFAEFNIFADPGAAAQVFAANLPGFTAIGLDVTNRATLRRDRWRELAAMPTRTSAAEVVHRIAERWFTDQDIDTFALHDPLAVAVVDDPALVNLDTAEIHVDCGPDRSGQTREVGPGSIAFAASAALERFEHRFLEVLIAPVTTKAT